MATPTSRREVIYSPDIRAELDTIWEWNAERYSIAHADAYLYFLKQFMSELAVTYPLGRLIGTNPDLRYRLIRRKSKGHEHVVVFRLIGDEVQVLHIFHTAQDWQANLQSGKS